MFEKHIECPQCHGEKRIKSGPLAIVKTSWNCPKCGGTGRFTLGLYDRILFAIAMKFQRMLWKYTMIC